MKSRRKKFNSIDYSYDYAIIEDYEELQTKYIRLFIDLKTHKSIVDADFYLAAQKALTQQFLDEYALLLEKSRHKTSEQFYLAESLNSVLNISEKRRRRVFRRSEWQNSAMKEVLDARVNAVASGYISELLEGVEPPEEDEKEESVFEEENITEPESHEAESEQAEVPAPDDESALDELYELEEELGEELDENNYAEEPSGKVELPPVVAAEQTAMAFVPMSAEPAETADENAETANAADTEPVKQPEKKTKGDKTEK